MPMKAECISLVCRMVTVFLPTAGVARISGQSEDRADRERTAPCPEWTRIGAGKDASEWSQVLATGYGMPLGLARMFSPEALGADMASDASTQFFGVRHDGQLVATSMLVLSNGLAAIYCVATLPGERGRGLGAYVTAEALRTAHRIGYRVGVLQSSDEGHSVYLALGFADLGWVPMFIRMPA